MSISYESGSRASGGFIEPIRSAWNSLGEILGSLIAFFMMAFTVVIPVGLVAYGSYRLLRWLRDRSPATAPAGQPDEQSGSAS